MTTQEQNIPRLRFPEFKASWTEVKFGDLYKFIPTNSFSREKLNYDSGELKNIHYGDIHTKFSSSFYIGEEVVPYVNHDLDVSKISDYKYCVEGDVIFADASEDYLDVGKAMEIIDLSDQKLISGLHTLHARPKKNQALGFFSHLLKTWHQRKQMMVYSQGSKVLGISSKRISAFDVFITSFEEQTKITSFLSSIDFKIKQLKSKKELLALYKKGMEQKLFSQNIRFKNDEGNDYPVWQEKKLSSIARIYDGTHQTPKYVKKGIPFYSVEHVTANQFKETRFISEEVFENEKKRAKIEKGDVLMTRIGDIGTAKYINWDVCASFYVSLALIKPLEGVSGKYLSFCIHGEKFQRELWKKTIHVAFPKKINLGEIGNCLIQVPSFEEQLKISSFLFSINKKIELVDTELEKAESFKRGLLQQMFI